MVSIAAHGLVAVWLARCMDHAPVPDEPVRLDVTRVDLSFAETPDETAAVQPAASAQPIVGVANPSQPKTEPPTLPEPIERAMPRAVEPDAGDLPQPDEPLEALVTPEAPHAVAVAPRQAMVDAPPKPRRAITPEYPREARRRGEEGGVTLEIGVTAEGRVDGVRVVASSTHALLDDAAIRAVRAALFTPAESGGRAVYSTVRLTLNFRLK